MKLKALIVDDERLARKELISMLADFENIEIVGEADDVDSAERAINQLDPDIVFLDIQMPGDSGFDLLERVNVRAKIIFVTAFDEYAIRAFEINALDYLLKPVNPIRLKDSIERFDETSIESDNRELKYSDRLLLTMNNHLRFLKISEIVVINSAGDYSEIVTSDGKKSLTLKTMKEWEIRLPENFFTRIHRSTIINLELVDKLEEWFNNSYRVYMKNFNEPWTISRRYVTKLRERFS